MMDERRSSNASYTLTRSSWGVKSATYAGKYRNLSETLTGYRGPRRPVINACKHQRVKYQPLSTTLTEPGAARDTIAGVFPITLAGAADPALDPRAAYYSSELNVGIGAADLEELNRQMAGDVQPIVNVPNMILELPQALNLWHDLKKPLMAALSLARKNKKSSLRRLKDGSNALLAQQFGLLPLVGDLVSLLSLSKKVHSEVKRLTTLPPDWEKATKKCSPSLVTLSRSLENRSFGYMTLATDAETSEEAIVVHYLRKRSRVISADASLYSGLVNQLTNMNNPLAVLWEATPFSFAVDWFYPIGDRLKQLSGSTLSGLLLCKDICTTVKVKRTVPVRIMWNGAPPAICGVITDSYFRRYVGLPPVSSTWDQISLPGIRQGTLAGALLLQRVNA